MAAYFVLFFVSTVLLFSFSLLLLDTGICKVERERVRPKINAYVQQGKQLGLDALLDTLRNEHGSNKSNDIYIRLVNPEGMTLWLTVPRQLDELASEYFTPSDPKLFNGWQIYDLPTQNDVDVFSHKFKDGYKLYVGRTTERQEVLVETLRSIFVFIIIGIVLIGGGGGAVLAYQVLRPLRNLTTTVKEVSKGDMTSRVPVSNHKGELDELAELVNDMLQRIETLVIAMRNALDNLGHDLRTPLTRMKTHIERTLLEQASYDEQRETLIECSEEIERINTLITMLMDIAEAETGQMRLKYEAFSAKNLLHDLVEYYEIIAEDKGIVLSYDSEDILITADRHRLAQALGNLLDNALKYTPEGGSVSLWAKCGEDNLFEIAVVDTGIGIPVEERERVFEKLYRLDKSRSEKGIGLGLSLVKAVISAHHGEITIKDGEKGGSLFLITLPVSIA